MKIVDDNLEISRYLEDVARHPLLTADEEARLTGIWAERNHAGPFTRQQAAAKRELIRCNVKLVISIAKGYRNRGMPFIDVIQDGIIGLARAIDKFDPEKGFRLSTYATWWIRQACQRAVTSYGGTIRVPAHVNWIRARTFQILEENPNATREEIAKILECSVHHIENAVSAVRVTHTLDWSEGDTEGGRNFNESVVDDNAEDPAEMLEREDFMRATDIQHVLARLPEDERRVIELRFGFYGVHAHAFSEVAKVMGIPTHKAQALQKTALRKLGHIIESDAILSPDETEFASLRNHTSRRGPARGYRSWSQQVEFMFSLIPERVLGRCDCAYESDIHHNHEDAA